MNHYVISEDELTNLLNAQSALNQYWNGIDESAWSKPYTTNDLIGKYIPLHPDMTGKSSLGE